MSQFSKVPVLTCQAFSKPGMWTIIKNEYFTVSQKFFKYRAHSFYVRGKIWKCWNLFEHHLVLVELSNEKPNIRSMLCSNAFLI